jgi:hypothetical protein
LAPLYEPGIAVRGAQRRRTPEGGWQQWLDEITANETVATAQSGNRDLTATFQETVKAAEGGSVPAQAALAMMYANGKGVQQSYNDAGKWWIKAAEGGDLVAAWHAWNLYRNGEGVERNPEIANRWAVVIGEPVRPPRNPQPTPTSAAPATTSPANR